MDHELIIQVYDNDNTWTSIKLIDNLLNAAKEYGEDTPATLVIYTKLDTEKSTILKGTFKEIINKIYERRNISQTN